MNHQDLINTCIFEQIQGLLFSDLSGPLTLSTGWYITFCYGATKTTFRITAQCIALKHC